MIKSKIYALSASTTFFSYLQTSKKSKETLLNPVVVNERPWSQMRDFAVWVINENFKFKTKLYFKAQKKDIFKGLGFNLT